MGDTNETQLGTARLYKAAKIAYAPVDMRQTYNDWVRMPSTNLSPSVNQSELENNIERILPRVDYTPKSRWLLFNPNEDNKKALIPNL
tara:strand:+ start:401 stop:664 length:264 start_codon:yes stop_codon:yes gene_type:complete